MIQRRYFGGLRAFYLGDNRHAACRRQRPGFHGAFHHVAQGSAAIGEFGAAHHLDETIVDDGEAAVRAEHAQAVRHVVQGGVELPGERSFAFAGHQGIDENVMQIEIDQLEADEEQHQQPGKAGVIRTAMQRQGQRHRPA